MAAIYRSDPRSPGRLEEGQRQRFCIAAGLQSLEPRACPLAEQIEIETQSFRPTSLEASQPFTKKDRGAPQVAALQVEMGHRHLEDSLEHWPHRACSFVPELLEAVVAGVPLAAIEQRDGLPQTGIGHQIVLLGAQAR